MFNPEYNPAIYSASKIWHNLKWRKMRDIYGYNITSRWIDVECGTYENPTGAKIFTPEEKVTLWTECDEDITKADMTIVYGEPRDEIRGASVEFGMTLGQRKPTYFIGDSPFFTGNRHSDAAYMHHPLVHRIDVPKFGDRFDYVIGYHRAVAHYRVNYHNPERFFKLTPFLNANPPSSLRGLHKEAAFS